MIVPGMIWARRQFRRSALPDERLRRRASTVVTAMVRSPGRSIPELFDTSADAKAAYNLFKHPSITPETLQSGHRSLTRNRLREAGTYLLIEDTTELIWYRRDAVEGLGMVSSKHGQGFLLHSVLAVHWSDWDGTSRPPLAVLGLVDQQYYLRQPIPAGEKDNDSLVRQNRPRESQLWEQAGERIGAAPPSVRWVRVCDRGADIYEFLQSCRHLGHGFVVRAAQDRLLCFPQATKLFEIARQAESLGGFDLPLRSRPGHAARTAHLHISAQAVGIQSPLRPGYARGALPPVPCTVVRVWEPDPAVGAEPLEWILLVDSPVASYDEALNCARQYASRWLIEEFHKVLKSGMGAERLQLESSTRLMAAISLMSLAAIRVVELKERARLIPDEPAESTGLTSFELQVLAARLQRDIRTVRDVVLAIGRLGGHMNRKGDGMPGITTLWRGLRRLQDLTEGARLALQPSTYG